MERNAIHRHIKHSDPLQRQWQLYDWVQTHEGIREQIQRMEAKGNVPHRMRSYIMYKWLRDYNIPPTVFMQQPQWAIDDIEYFALLNALYDLDLAIEQTDTPKFEDS